MLEYMKKLEYVSGRIVELDISKAMEIPELSEVEYEILEPGYCPNVPVGEIYLVTDSHENGLQIYVNREVESLPYVSGLDVSGANKKYENAGFKSKTHVQICVRNTECIMAYFLPRTVLL